MAEEVMEIKPRRDYPRTAAVRLEMQDQVSDKNNWSEEAVNIWLNKNAEIVKSGGWLLLIACTIIAFTNLMVKKKSMQKNKQTLDNKKRNNRVNVELQK